jgi:hypothetical protein
MSNPSFTPLEPGATANSGTYSLTTSTNKIEMYSGYFRHDNTANLGSNFGTSSTLTQTFGTGSFVIKHTDAGVGEFKVNLAVRIYSGYGTEAKDKGAVTVSLTTNATITNITSPN